MYSKLDDEVNTIRVLGHDENNNMTYEILT